MPKNICTYIHLSFPYKMVKIYLVPFWSGVVFWVRLSWGEGFFLTWCNLIYEFAYFRCSFLVIYVLAKLTLVPSLFINILWYGHIGQKWIVDYGIIQKAELCEIQSNAKMNLHCIEKIYIETKRVLPIRCQLKLFTVPNI